jgi:hypothetical protein
MEEIDGGRSRDKGTELQQDKMYIHVVLFPVRCSYRDQNGGKTWNSISILCVVVAVFPVDAVKPQEVVVFSLT